MNNKIIKKIGIKPIIVSLFIICIVTFFGISLRGSYLEVLEIGEEYLDIYWTNLKYNCNTFLANFFFVFLYIIIINFSIKRGLKTFFEDEKKEMPKLPNKSIALILSVMASLIMNKPLTESFIKMSNVAWFGINDPIFNYDIGFYFFQAPFIKLIIKYFIGLMICTIVYEVVYHIICFNVLFDGVDATTLKNSKFLKNIKIQIMIAMIGLAASIIFNIQNILFGKFLSLDNEIISGLYGAGSVEVIIKICGQILLAIVMCLSVFWGIRAYNKQKTESVFKAILVVPIYLVFLFIVMVGYKAFFINSNELDSEKQYISHNIDFTKNAYNINIETVDLDEAETIGSNQIEKNINTIENIPIVDEDITLRSLNISQTSTGYYSYEHTKLEQYMIDGKNKLMYISPREIISNGNRTYNNKTYEYTHGFSIIASLVNTVNEKGNIEYLQKGFEEKEKININQPRIYFGLSTNSTIVTNASKNSEFDYPDSNNDYNYNGEAGLSLNFLDRLILGMKKKNVKIALSNNVNQNSKILINRNIIERAKKILPNVLYDEEPYLVISDDGKIVWVLDAYTVSDSYPYSNPTVIEHEGMKKEINYIRNSIKVIVDCYDGSLKFYLTDTTDPIAIAYKNIYPNLFEESEIPETIANHIVYSEFLYKIQANMIKAYHGNVSEVLYRTDDIWNFTKYTPSITTNKTTASGISIEPYYTKLTNAKGEEEFGLVMLYTPEKKQNLISYLVGTYNKNIPKLTLYEFSNDSSVLGTMQLEQQIVQDEIISNEISQINVSGMKLLKKLIVVPIENQILYVEPIYQLSLNEANSLPTLKKVVVASGNKIAIGNNLKEALDNLVSQEASYIEVEKTDTVQDLINEIIKANNNLEEASDSSDWETTGKYLNKLQVLIEKLEVLNNIENTQKNTLINEEKRKN